MSPKLKPCPFCGGDQIGVDRFDGSYNCDCLDCGAEGPICKSEKIAANRWNTRKVF